MRLKNSNSVTAEISSEIYRDMVEEIFSSDPAVKKILDRVLGERGKSIRPQFMAIVASLAGGTRTSLRKAAMAIETVHIASLIHDDVLDGSSLRRGVETINARYSDKISVLSGDYIFVKAMKMAHDLENPEMMSVILRSVERMIDGEIRDSLVSGIIDEDTYLSIAADKTAALFAASGELGILLSGTSDGKRVWGRELGENVGTAFQIVDDTLDYRGEADVTGKPGLMDVRAGRMTLPLIYSLREFDQDEIEEMLHGGTGSIDELSAIVNRNGGIEYALGRAHEFLGRARDISRRFGNKAAQNTLDEFLGILLERNF